MTKVTVTVELELSELPDEVRSELADGLNFRADEDETLAADLDTVPRVSEMTGDEIENVVRELFSDFGDYDVQAEMWGGSEFYGFISASNVVEISVN